MKRFPCIPGSTRIGRHLLEGVFTLMLCFVWIDLSYAFSLRLLHLNDSHSRLDTEPYRFQRGQNTLVFSLGGAARIAAAVHRLAEGHDHVLFLHAGDSLRGTAYYTVFGGTADMAVLNLLGIDAMVLGNHEFDDGADHLATLLNDISFPVLAANITIRPGSALDGRVRPWTLFSMDGVHIGVFGLILPATATISSPGPDVAFTDPFAAARRAVSELRREGADIVIALTHQGYDRDCAMARALRGIDIVVGGHSHSLLGPPRLKKAGFHPEGPYPTVITGPQGKRVFVVQAFHNFKVLGALDIEYDEHTGTVTAAGHSDILVDPQYDVTLRNQTQRRELSPQNRYGLTPMKPDIVMAGLVQGFSAQLGEDTVVAHLDSSLSHRREPNAYGQGSEVAPLVAQALFEAAEHQGVRVDAALINGGGIRDSLHQGDVTERDIDSVLPFGNTVVVLHLTGKQLKAAIAHGVHHGGGAFPAVYGLRIEGCPTPKGSWIMTGLFLDGGASSGQAIDDKKQYTLVTITYLAQGGDGYPLKGVQALPLVPTVLERQAMKWFLQKTPRVYPQQAPVVTVSCP
ncbi:bifunctional metallophosphatase/5'-nucleotidase [Desulfovibrio inopinatus]|uniref:bifunctional metallophosphatase/5'-nucleotidase n=1 Tax=Desulfovibrio inopinatus TaxID=102109 RepID=UPI000485D7B6|nr:bifunctional metallophosphatase/5'-nucleotidase [Desulfovibrio inopinatus]